MKCEKVYDELVFQRLHEILVNDDNVEEPYQTGSNTPVCYEFLKTRNFKVNGVIIKTNCVEIAKTTNTVYFTFPLDERSNEIIGFVKLDDLCEDSFEEN